MQQTQTKTATQLMEERAQFLYADVEKELLKIVEQDNIPQPFKQDNIPQLFKQDNIPKPFKQDNIPQPFKQDNIPQPFKQDNIPKPFKQDNIPKPKPEYNGLEEVEVEDVTYSQL